MAVATFVPQEDAMQSERENSDPSVVKHLAPQARFLDAVFSLAVRHDHECLREEDVLYRFLGIRQPTIQADVLQLDETLSDYRCSVIELCAAITKAALGRTPPPYFASEMVDCGIVDGLSAPDAEDFLRPIFEESGIGHRFEPSGKYTSRE